ncbi:MAG: hypothetical protein GY913_02125 [Proteobacteria bacterium]|nr:hypothetical protein [Pseudomonadota bacterium]MCP4915696.1 hypothetical protein [Pseudomonadota bacterium]
MWWMLVGASQAGWRAESKKAQREFESGKALVIPDPVAAEEHLRAAVEREPDCGQCTHLLAQSLMFQGRGEEALDLELPLTEQFPDNPGVWLVTSSSAYISNRPDLVLSAALAASELTPSDWNAALAIRNGLLTTG